jgi:hypothetical protein
MVEPITIGVVVAALLAKALDRAEDATIDATGKGVQRLLSVLRHRADVEPAGSIATTLPALESTPDSPKRVQALAEAVDATIDRSDELRSELEAVLDDLRRAGMSVGTVTQTADGDGNVQISGIQGSTINVGLSGERRP